MQAPALVITIDTEEEGLWTGRYPMTGQTCRNILGLPRIHAVFDRLRVQPTYLIDHPVAIDAQARSVLRELAATSELGAHLHAWCTPPFAADETSTYSNQLPSWLQEAKLRRLCDAIEAGFGRRPTAYRAGRWGFDHTTVPVLETLGFTVDSSVIPLWWEPDGPSFVGAPQVPYRLDRDDVCRAGSSRVWEVPVSRFVAGRHGELVERVLRHVPPTPGLRGLMQRAGLTSLCPEQHTLPELIALADTMAARGAPMFNVAFHSTAALPGATPYVPDARALDAFVFGLESLLTHLLDRHGAVSRGLSQVAAELNSNPVTLAA